MGTTALGVVAANTNVLAAMVDAWAANPTFACSGKLSVYTDVQNNQGYTGSGVLISSNWVLTAGHVITTAANIGRTIQQIRFKMGPDALNPINVVTSFSWTCYPGYNGSGTGQGIDLALVCLSEPVTNASPAVLYNQSLASLVGQHCYTTANGSRGVAGQPLFPADYLARAAQNILFDCAAPVVDADYVWWSFSAPSDFSAEPLEGMGSPGDSGGPVWVVTNSQWKVAAIMSGVRTFPPYYDFGDETYAYFVGAQLDWIYGVIGVKPALSIQCFDAGSVRVQWPAWASSYALQTSTDLAGTNWTAASGIVDNGAFKSATFGCTNEPARFFRLLKQPTPQSSAKPLHGPPPPPGSWDDLIGRDP